MSGEGILNSDLTLNWKGNLLKEFFTGVTVPTPVPTPIPAKIEFVHKTGTKEYGIQVDGKYVAANTEEAMRPMLLLLLLETGIYAFNSDNSIDYSKAKEI